MLLKTRLKIPEKAKEYLLKKAAIGTTVFKCRAKCYSIFQEKKLDAEFEECAVFKKWVFKKNIYLLRIMPDLYS